MSLPKICHCGKELHLTATQKLMLESMVNQWSESKKVTIAGGKTYIVPTYYILSHGLKANEIPYLGFKEFAS